MRKKYDDNGLPIVRHRLFSGLTIRDLLELAGMFVFFLGAIVVWVLFCWWVFQTARGIK